MKKLQKILMATVLVSMLAVIFAVFASAAEMTPAKVIASYSGEESVASTTTGTQKHSVATITKTTGNKYYEIDFIDKGANVNFNPSPNGNYAFLGKGDYIVVEYDFMAEDWTKVQSLLIGWNSRNNTGGALNDMHFSYTNVDGAPQISSSPLKGSITLDPTPGVWHHFTMIVQIGGAHEVITSGNLTAIQGQDAVEAYAYVDGQLFAQNLIGDGKEFWSKNTTFFQSFRITANTYGGQMICIDNLRVMQYETTRELREFFKARQTSGQIPDINATAYPFLDYSADYDYPLGNATMKVVEMNGTETLYDRFDKAAKYAAAHSGAKVVLLSDVKDAVVKYPILVDRAGFEFKYELSPTLRSEQEESVNPITGEKSVMTSFVKKTKYAYYQWEVDHTGEKLDSRGYTPLAVGAPVQYSGYEAASAYFLDGKLYTLTGEWMLNGTVLAEVPAYAANSYYRLAPVIVVKDVYAIITTDEAISYVTAAEDFASAVKNAPAGAVVTLVRDVSLTASLAVNKAITLDLAGRKLSVMNENGLSAIVLADSAEGFELKSSVAGGSVEALGALFEAACAFTVNGENVVAKGAALVQTDASIRGIVINGGAFVLSGETAFVLGEEASLQIAVRAALVAANGASVSLVDPAADYEISLGGVIYGIEILASDVSEVVLEEGLALNGVSAILGEELVAGVRVEGEELVIASKKLAATYGGVVVETAYAVVDKAEAALVEWEAGVSEYFAVGETIYHFYSDKYDTKKYYTPNGKYELLVNDKTVIGNVIEEEFAGMTIVAEPCFNSFGFFVVAVKPDGTFVHYENATKLASLLSSGEYEDGTVFAIGRQNMLLESAVIAGDYAIDLNGHALTISGANRIENGALRIFSSAEGASFYSDATQAFLVEGGALVVEDVCYIGGVLADLDAAASLEILGGVFYVDADVLYRAASGATVSIEALSANKQLFAAAAGYAWTAVNEEITVNGSALLIVAKYGEISE